MRPDFLPGGAAKMKAMGVKLNKVPKLNTEELTDSEALLLRLVRERDERIQELTDELAHLYP